MDRKTAFALGFIITIAALILTDRIEKALTPKKVTEFFPDLDEVTKWRLHKEVLQILKEAKPDAV